MSHYEPFPKIKIESVNIIRISKRDHLQRVEDVHTDMLNALTDSAILTKHNISRATLKRYKQIIENRQLDTYKKLSNVKAESIFITQIERMENLIRYVHKWIENNPKRNPVGMLRLSLDACSRICDYQFRVGAIKEVPKELRYEDELKAEVIRKQMKFVAAHILKINPKLAEELIFALKNLPDWKAIE